MALRLAAHAKVNLQLAILGRRADGYHLIHTCLHTLELADQLVVAIGGEGVELTLDARTDTGLDVTAGADNLICRAAQVFRGAAGITEGVRFSVQKRIPAGAGLGGGSSDAATALLLLNALFDRPLEARQLHDLAAGLGADVPFFLRGGTCIGTGVGDQLTPIDSPRLHFVLILPPFGLSTAKVYAACDAPRLTEDDAATSMLLTNVVSGRDLAVPGRFVNDLEHAAMQVEPRLADLRDKVVAAGHPTVRMSGSGSALFVATPDERAAADAFEALRFLEEDGVDLVQTRSEVSPVREPHSLDAEGER